MGGIRRSASGVRRQGLPTSSQPAVALPQHLAGVHRFEDNFKFDATTQRDNFALAPAHTTWLAFPGPSGAPAYCA